MRGQDTWFAWNLLPPAMRAAVEPGNAVDEKVPVTVLPLSVVDMELRMHWGGTTALEIGSKGSEGMVITSFPERLGLSSIWGGRVSGADEA
jgi:hypothetical protein